METIKKIKNKISSSIVFLIAFYIVLCILVSVFVKICLADVPDNINYQGRLRYQGQPVSGDIPMRFSIYSDPNGGSGNRLWAENTDVKVSTGVYSHKLGTVSNMGITWDSIDWAQNGQSIYLGVDIGNSGDANGNNDLLPRMKFEAVPFSFVSRQLWDASNNIVTSGGNVGIGTTDPQGKLHIPSLGTCFFIEPGLDGDIGIGTTNPQNFLDIAGAVVIGSGYAGSINAQSNSLLVQGNIGIGKTNPTAKLYVDSAGADGAIVMDSDDDFTPSFVLSQDTLTRAVIRYLDSQNTLGLRNAASGNDHLMIATDGNVGIGDYTPEQELMVNGSIGFTDKLRIGSGAGAPYIDLDSGARFLNGDDWTGLGITCGSIIVGYDGGHSGAGMTGTDLVLADGTGSGNNITARVSGAGTTYFNGGNVGIGTENMVEKLNVDTGNITLKSGNRAIGVGTDLGSYKWYADDDSSGEALEEAAAINYVGTGIWDGTSSNANMEFKIKTSADVAPSTKMVITQGGNVGIGDTNPSAKLEIFSDVNTESGIIVNTWGGSSYGAIETNSWGDGHALSAYSDGSGYAVYANAPGGNAGYFAGNVSVTGSITASNQPGCNVYLNASQDLYNSDTTCWIQYNAEDFDTAGMHSNSTNPDRVTITEAGTYLITASVSISLNATGSRSFIMEIRNSGGTTLKYLQRRLNGSACNIHDYLNLDIITTEQLNVGDYIRTRAWQNSGSQLSMMGTSGNWRMTYLTVQKLN